MRKRQPFASSTRRALPTLLGLMSLMWPVHVLASGESGGTDHSVVAIQNVLLLLAVVVIAYLITHLLLERIQRRFGIVTGVEYIVLGVVIGPGLALLGDNLSLLDAHTLQQFTPALMLGTGSLGLMTGLNLNFRTFSSLDFESLRIALWMTLITLACVVLTPLCAIYAFFSIDVMLAWMPGIMCMGAVACVADQGPLQALRKFLAARGGSTEVAIQAARLCSSLAIIWFGMLFCMFAHKSVFLPAQFGMLEWFTIQLVLGILLGVIFSTFLRRDFDEEKILTVIIGMVIFTSGIAYYLKLSPIFCNFILGVVLINLNPRKKTKTMDAHEAPHIDTNTEKVKKSLASIERPLYIALFFIAGAALMFTVPWWSFFLVIPYFVLRSMGRLSGGLIAMRTSSYEPQVPALGRVMFAPGGLSVAMMLDFNEVFGKDSLGSSVYAGLLIAIIVSEVISYIRSRSWLIDYTDVPPRKIREVLGGGEQAQEN